MSMSPPVTTPPGKQLGNIQIVSWYVYVYSVTRLGRSFRATQRKVLYCSLHGTENYYRPLSRTVC